ncbi:hypothetical protein HPB48_007384 [Haemaphysalis longicornis]|uniref:Uncharacterized protein n=1 Tax=Haemaphysalis longicornis TaxID=44386 RepID=A0A9J6G5P0_HAELO|nr:hypothetical protein HPB48_007384 [Haemaphysalis longicornis]
MSLKKRHTCKAEKKKKAYSDCNFNVARKAQAGVPAQAGRHVRFHGARQSALSSWRSSPDDGLCPFLPRTAAVPVGEPGSQVRVHRSRAEREPSARVPLALVRLEPVHGDVRRRRPGVSAALRREGGRPGGGHALRPRAPAGHAPAALLAAALPRALVDGALAALLGHLRGLRRHTVLCVRSRGKADQLALRQEACDPATRPRDTEPCPDDPRCPGAAAVLNGTSAAAAETTPTPPVIAPSGTHRREASEGAASPDEPSRNARACVCASTGRRITRCARPAPQSARDCPPADRSGKTLGRVSVCDLGSTHAVCSPIDALPCTRAGAARSGSNEANSTGCESAADPSRSSHESPPRPTASVVDIQSNTVLDIPLGDAPGDFWNLSGISGLPEILDLPTPRKVVVLEDARYAWRASKWSKCSRVCGGGDRHRRVKCVDKVTQKEVPQKSCYLHTQHLKPPEKSTCNIDPCLSWQTSEWSRVSLSSRPDRLLFSPQVLHLS